MFNYANKAMAIMNLKVMASFAEVKQHVKKNYRTNVVCLNASNDMNLMVIDPTYILYSGVFKGVSRLILL